MDEIESEAQSFIVRVWVEEHAEEGSLGVWRGQITQVPSGEYRYLKSLDEIVDFISPYLESMGVKPGMHWRIRQWYRRQTRQK